MWPELWGVKGQSSINRKDTNVHFSGVKNWILCLKQRGLKKKNNNGCFFSVCGWSDGGDSVWTQPPQCVITNAELHHCILYDGVGWTSLITPRKQPSYIFIHTDLSSAPIVTSCSLTCSSYMSICIVDFKVSVGLTGKIKVDPALSLSLWPGWLRGFSTYRNWENVLKIKS